MPVPSWDCALPHPHLKGVAHCASDCVLPHSHLKGIAHCAPDCALPHSHLKGIAHCAPDCALPHSHLKGIADCAPDCALPHSHLKGIAHCEGGATEAKIIRMAGLSVRVPEGLSRARILATESLLPGSGKPETLRPPVLPRG